MVDFNTKKNILQKLRKKRSENKLLWLPCVIAAAFVKLWYGTVCGIGMALSDKNGNFLGIKRSAGKTRTERKVRRQDDIVYVKKPFIGRVMSAVLAAAFVLMVAPELSVDLGINTEAVDITLRPDDIVENPSIGFTRVGSVDSTQVDYLDYYYRNEDWARIYGKTVSSPIVTPAYESAKIEWELQGVSTSAQFEYFYEVSYVNPRNQKTVASPDWQGTDFIFGEDGNGERLQANTRYKFSVRPGLRLPAYKIDLVTQPKKDTDGNPILDADGKPEMENVYKITDIVTIIQYGTEIVTAAQYDVNVKLSDVTNVNATVIDGKTAVQLKWKNTSVTNNGSGDRADAFAIYRADWNTRTNGYGDLVQVKNSPYHYMEDDVTFVDRTVTPGNRYAYFIVAYKDLYNRDNAFVQNKFIPGVVNSAAPVAGEYHTVVSVSPAAVQNVTVTSNKKDTLTISWDPPGNSNVEGYYVYRTTDKTIEQLRNEMNSLSDEEKAKYLDENGDLEFSRYVMDKAHKITKTSDTSCQDPIGKELNSQLSNDDQYYYFVIPYVTVDRNSSELFGPVESNFGSVGASLEKPQGFIAESGDGKVELKWNPVAGADGYRVYITKTKNHDGSNEGVGETTTDDVATPSYSHVGLYNKDEYSYYVKAYTNVASNNDEDKTKLFSKPSDTRKVVVGVPLNAPEDFLAVPGDGTVSLSWKPVTGAEGYEVHYWKNGGEEKQVDRSTGNYNHINLKNGDVYNYYVVPYKTVNGVRVHGAQSETLTVTVGILLNVPQDLVATTIDGQITVSWSPVQGAEGYVLHYRNRNSSEGEKKIDLSRTTFNHIGLKNGDVYEYWVEAYKEVNGVRVLSDPSVTISQMVGAVLDAPKDFTATTADGVVNLTWTAVDGAEGYIIHASSGGRYYQFDVSKVTYAHTDLNNGDIWTYYVTAYKTVNGSRTYSNPSESKTVTIGISLNSAVDLTATAGNRQIDLSWTAVNGADGYVVYLYNSSTMEFEPITVTSKTTYSHVGLKNGKQYTYMVAPYKNINGKRFYGDYSMSVTAIPTTGSITDMDHELIVKGTAPYGISHSEYITAVSNHGAFEESVDVYFSTSRESTQEVRDVLKNYADGLSSFIIYPFDISIYRENTYIEVDPEDGYTVTITMPVPDRLIAYRDYITVVHIGDGVDESEEISLAEDWYNNYDQRLEVLPCAIVDIDNVWCVQFKCSSFSPYALVIYKEHIQDVASGGGLMDTGFSDTFNSGLLLFTALPDILPNNRKLKIVQSGSKRYHIKSVTKR